MSLTEFSELIAGLYAGAMEESPWATFFEQLRETLSAQTALLILRSPSKADVGLILGSGPPEVLPQEAHNIYSEKMFAVDPFVNLPTGQAVTLEEVIAVNELRASEFYKLTLEPANILYILGVDMQGDGGVRASLRLTRDKNAKNFDADDKAVCNLLVPHLQQAIEYYVRLNRTSAEKSLYSNAMNQLAVGSVILDDSGEVIDVNATADVLLTQNDGLTLKNGRLSAAHRQTSAKLKSLVTHVLTAQREQELALIEVLAIDRPSGRQPLGMVLRSVAHCERVEGQQNPAVAVFIYDPEHQIADSKAVLVELFKLTRSEASLALLLANGASLDEVSDALSISRNTARAHLRSIFSKTGVSQQTMLVSLVLKSVAGLGLASDREEILPS
ncbi:MAG: helix-turn-helix transcriptional regulator [Pseudomonadales bacterium]